MSEDMFKPSLGNLIGGPAPLADISKDITAQDVSVKHEETEEEKPKVPEIKSSIMTKYPYVLVEIEKYVPGIIIASGIEALSYLTYTEKEIAEIKEGKRQELIAHFEKLRQKKAVGSDGKYDAEKYKKILISYLQSYKTETEYNYENMSVNDLYNLIFHFFDTEKQITEDELPGIYLYYGAYRRDKDGYNKKVYHRLKGKLSEYKALKLLPIMISKYFSYGYKLSYKKDKGYEMENLLESRTHGITLKLGCGGYYTKEELSEVMIITDKGDEGT